MPAARSRAAILLRHAVTTMTARAMIANNRTPLAGASAASRRGHRALATTTTATATTLADRILPASRGQRLAEVDTPALIVDLDAVEHNCARLRAELEALRLPQGSVRVRPHFKAHKTPPLAAVVRSALGADLAPGACAQKLGEAEALIWSGALGQEPDVCITNEVAPVPGKMRRLAALARHGSGPRLSVVVDSAVGARALAEALVLAEQEQESKQRHPVGVLVEVNAGQDRCGVDTPEEAAELAALVAELASSSRPSLLTFLGVQGYHGGIQHVRRAEERREAASRAGERTAEAVRAIEARLGAGSVAVVTGGGSGTCLADAAGGVYNEVQPGSLFFGDCDYARNEPWPVLSGSGSSSSSAASWESRWRQASWIATTVASRSESRNIAVVDAGLKAVALDSGPPRVMIGGLAGGDEAMVEFRNGGDEHGVLLFPQAGTVPPGAAPELPPVGEVLRLLPGHCDPQFNLYDWVVAYRGGGARGGGGGDWRDCRVEGVWSVAARGPGT
jgi:D-serine deaminase-like pyridoxal phosphate-dependent protein